MSDNDNTRGSVPEPSACPGPGNHQGLSIPSINDIRHKAFDVLGKRPCLWQAKVCQAVLEGNRDVISIAGTGMGKTLTFWLPLLFRPKGIQIVVTPLNILGQQNVETLGKVGIQGIFLSADAARKLGMFQVCPHPFCNPSTQTSMQAILLLTYRVIVVNPEVLMHENGIFEHLFKNTTFMSSVISIVIDEAHCVSQWGSFRPEYRELGRLRHLQRHPCTVMATSATLIPSVIKDIKNVLSLREENLFFSQCPVDRPNISIAVRPFRNPRNSFFDLKFLLRDWQPGCPPPPTFIVFFDSIPESVSAGRYLRSLLPQEYEDCIMWFNSEMSDRFKTQQTSKFSKGKVWGLMATDSFGMVNYITCFYSERR